MASKMATAPSSSTRTVTRTVAMTRVLVARRSTLTTSKARRAHGFLLNFHENEKCVHMFIPYCLCFLCPFI